MQFPPTDTLQIAADQHSPAGPARAMCSTTPGHKLLLVAVAGGDESRSLELLDKKGADIDFAVVDDAGRSILHHAAKLSSSRVMERTLDFCSVDDVCVNLTPHLLCCRDSSPVSCTDTVLVHACCRAATSDFAPTGATGALRLW